MKIIYVAVTTEQHRALKRRAKAENITMSRLLLLPALELAGFKDSRQSETECRSCGKALVKTVSVNIIVGRPNRSGFCRECQRSQGLPQLRKKHG